MSSENEQAKQALGPGAQLRKSREAAGLSLVNVADYLRLKHHIVVAIEKDDYQKLGSHVFVKGYLRSYANMMGIPEKDILDKFESLGLVDENAAPLPTGDKVTRRFNYGEFFVKTFSYMVFIGIAYLVGKWWHMHHVTEALTRPQIAKQELPKTLDKEVAVKAEKDHTQKIDAKTEKEQPIPTMVTAAPKPKNQNLAITSSSNTVPVTPLVPLAVQQDHSKKQTSLTQSDNSTRKNKRQANRANRRAKQKRWFGSWRDRRRQKREQRRKRHVSPF